jgi:hypothetical protein
MNTEIETNKEPNKEELVKTSETASDNLSDNKINTMIEPETSGNYIYISVCSCSINCCIL